MRLVPVLALALSAGCALPRPYGEGVAHQALFRGGSRLLDHELFDGHVVYGLEVATLERDSGWGYELGGSYGAEERSSRHPLEAEFDELALGLRRTFDPDASARPFVGVGGVWTRIETTLREPTLELDDDDGAAFYAHAGMLWTGGRIAYDPGSEFLLGFDVRGSAGEDYAALELSLVFGAGR